VRVARASGSRSRAEALTRRTELLRNADLRCTRPKFGPAGLAAPSIARILPTPRARPACVLSATFREAIEQGRSEPFFQPLVTLASGPQLGVEALARWHHPRSGSCCRALHRARRGDGPDRRPGRGMLRAACRQAACWARERPGPAAELSRLGQRLTRPSSRTWRSRTWCRDTGGREPAAGGADAGADRERRGLGRGAGDPPSAPPCGPRCAVAVDDFRRERHPWPSSAICPWTAQLASRSWTRSRRDPAGAKFRCGVIVELGRVAGLIVAAPRASRRRAS